MDKKIIRNYSPIYKGHKVDEENFDAIFHYNLKVVRGVRIKFSFNLPF